MDLDLIEKDIQAIIDAGGTDADVDAYLKDNKIPYSGESVQPVETPVSVEQPVTQTKRPSVLAQFSRALTRRLPASQLKTLMHVIDLQEQGKFPEPLPGENINNMEEYVKRMNEALRPREEEIARKGTLAQFEEPIMAGLIVSGMNAPAATAQAIGKYALLDQLIKPKEWVEKLFPDAPPEAADIADMLGAVGKGKLATTRWIPEKVSAGIKGFFKGTSGMQLKKQQLKWEKQDVVTTATEAIREIKEKDTIIKRDLSVEIGNLNKQIETDKFTVGERVHQALPERIKAAGTKYETIQNITEEKMAAEGKQIWKGEAGNMYEQALAENQRLGLPDDTPVYQKIESLVRKYSLENPKTGEVLSDEIIPFKDFLKDIRSVFAITRKTMAKGARFTPGDTTIMVLRKYYGDILAAKNPEFAALQKQYSPVIDFMNTASSVFKPYIGKYKNLSQAWNLLERFAKGKNVTSREIELIDMLEKGNDFFPGMGDITSGLKQKGLLIQQHRNALKTQVLSTETAIKRIKDVKAAKIAKITPAERKLITELIKKRKIESIKDIVWKAGLTAAGLGVLNEIRKKVSP